MSDQPYKPYSPLTSTPDDQPDPARIGVTRLTPIFEHWCSVCGRGAGFRFGGDFSAGSPGLWTCREHRDEVVETKWKRS